MGKRKRKRESERKREEKKRICVSFCANCKCVRAYVWACVCTFEWKCECVCFWVFMCVCLSAKVLCVCEWVHACVCSFEMERNYLHLFSFNFLLVGPSNNLSLLTIRASIIIFDASNKERRRRKVSFQSTKVKIFNKSFKTNVVWLGSALHRGSIVASHYTARGSILSIPKYLFWCCQDLLMALLRGK